MSSRCSILDCFSSVFLLFFLFVFLTTSLEFLFRTHTHINMYLSMRSSLSMPGFDDWWMGENIMNAYLICTTCCLKRQGGGDRQAGTSAFKQYKWRTLNQANEHPNKHTNMSKWQIPRRTHTSFTRSRIAHGRPQKLRLMRDNLFGRPRLEGAGTHLHQVCVLEID